MPFNLLLLPLLGGYILLSRWYPTRFLVLRSQGHRLILYSSVVGVILALVASLFCSCWLYVHDVSFQAVQKLWYGVVPFPHSGKAALAFLFGILSPLLNLFSSKERAIDRAIHYRGDALELLIYRAFKAKKMVAFTMKNGRVYVGNIIKPPNPILATQSVSLLPQISGFRDSDTREYVFTADYRPTYHTIREETDARVAASLRELGEYPQGTEEWERRVQEWIMQHRSELVQNERDIDFELVLPVAEIESAHLFDPEVYSKHFQKTVLKNEGE